MTPFGQAAGGLAGAGLLAQDVELLGETHGTRPPEAYFEQLREDPGSFQFHREGLDRLDHLLRSRGQPGLQEVLRPNFQMEGPALGPIGPREGGVEGAFPFPLVLGLFDDSPDEPPYTSDRIREEFFDGPNSRGATLTELYDEMSGGRVDLEGFTYDWVRTGLTREEVTGGVSGLRSEPTAKVASFIEEVVTELDERGVDWSRFDHTGDGFVDILTVMHPTRGAECAAGDRDNRIWSHRWNLQSASGGRIDPGIETATPRPDGDGYIKIRDYTIQPALSCDGDSINEIGVFAHELGHAFGLPDLYSTGNHAHRGAGNWDLMGTGTWGCSGGSPHRPCHMGAWSKYVLGWLDVEVVEPGRDHGLVTLEPVVPSGRALKLETEDGSGEFLLVENRQRVGGDSGLMHPGLLVWQVDPEVVENRWSSNAVNRDPQRMGVWLRQADGSESLLQEGGGRGSPGDPFPGCIRDDHLDQSEPCRHNREFHAGSDPGSWSQQGTPMGFTFLEIRELGDGSANDPSDVEFRLLTRFQEVRVETEGVGESGPAAAVSVDGSDPFVGGEVLESAPFQTHEIVAEPGVEFSEGFRVGFLEWTDGASRERTFTTGLADTTLVARYGGTEVRLGITLDSPVEDISPGEIELEPASDDGWVPEGEEVRVEAVPRTGFGFREWRGALSGEGNPQTLVADGPVDLEGVFDLTYGVADAPDDVQIEAARLHEITFQVENANAPVAWSLEEGDLPDGLELDAEEGVLNGAPMEPGEFTVEVRARDAIGLEAHVEVTLNVSPPVLSRETLVGPFLGTGDAPTTLQKEYLDRHGNADGSYDVGDLRAHLQREREGPTAAVAPAGEPVEILVPLGSVLDRREDGEREGGGQEEPGRPGGGPW